MVQNGPNDKELWGMPTDTDTLHFWMTGDAGAATGQVWRLMVIDDVARCSPRHDVCLGWREDTRAPTAISARLLGF